MLIEEFITPVMACSGISIGSAVRKGNILLAVMHDTGISAYGFQGMESALRAWMKAHGFPVTN